jgi:hypothetical protein
MKTWVETQSGQIYVLDNVKMTWARLADFTSSDPASIVDGGDLSSFPDIKLDEPMIILGPPQVPWTWARIIMTTPVRTLTHESTGFASGRKVRLRGHNRPCLSR